MNIFKKYETYVVDALIAFLLFQHIHKFNGCVHDCFLHLSTARSGVAVQGQTTGQPVLLLSS